MAVARKGRIRFEGAIYHAFNRGIDRRRLFWDEKDDLQFLDGLGLGVERFHVRVFAYCLMANHFHLLVETPLGNIDRFMQCVQTRYAGWFNLRHGRSGYVYQGPYRAKLVADDRYLLRLSRYIHLNAVRTNELGGCALQERVSALRSYRWSSYREYTGLAKPKEWMSYEPVEAHVREQMGGRVGAYRTFVEAGLSENDEEMDELLHGGGVCIGEADDLAELRGRLERREGSGRSAAGLGGQGRYLSPTHILAKVREAAGDEAAALKQRKGGAWLRGVAAEMLCRYGGLTNGEAAAQLGLGTGAAVSVLRKNLRIRTSGDRRLASLCRELEAVLSPLVF